VVESAARWDGAGPALPPTVPATTDNIQVLVRIRPGASRTDLSLHSWDVNDTRTRLTYTGKEEDGGGTGVPFRFNKIFLPDSTTQQLYDECVRPNVLHYTKGFNTTVFVYGQTASGKTHTMQGDGPSTPGVTQMAIHQIFETVAADPSRLYMLKCSYVEIYLEEINDLLCAGKDGKNRPLREVSGQFVVSGLVETVVTSVAEVYAVIEKGNANRKVGVSNLNEHSSRSHSIFRLTLESAVRTKDTSSALSPPPLQSTKLSGAVCVSDLSLVDLAGSETLSYDFGSSQQKETKSINMSLTQLKSVITALSKKESFIPYRNSVLTRLLRQALGGNARTLLCCTMNPLSIHARTSKSTLNFGQMAQTITNHAVQNEVGDDAGLTTHIQALVRLLSCAAVLAVDVRLLSYPVAGVLVCFSLCVRVLLLPQP